MIEIISGSLGSGKSTYCAWQSALHARRKGGWVIAANYSPPRSWRPRRAGHWITTTSVDDLYICQEYMADRRKGVNDYPGLLILDDCHMIFNARQWQKNSPWIEFLSNSRKLGWRVFLVTHSDNMIDKQIRNFVEYATYFRSLRKVFIPWVPFDIPLVPWPIPEQFFYVRRYYGQSLGRGEIATRGMFGLSSTLPYSSGSVFRADGIQGDVVEYASDRGSLLSKILAFSRRLLLRSLPIGGVDFDSQPSKPVNCSRHIIYSDGCCIHCGKRFC